MHPLQKQGSYRLLLLLCLMLWGTRGYSQDTSPGPAITYQIKGDNPTQPLPPPLWTIEEGDQPLSVEDVRSGNLKDATWIDLTTNRALRSDGSRAYWLHLRISSEIDVEAWHLLIERFHTSTWYDVDQAIMQMTAHVYQGETKIREGYSGRQIPADKRDFKSNYFQSILLFDMAAGDTLDIWVNYSGPPGFISTLAQIHPADYEFLPAPWPFQLTTFNFYLGFLCTLFIIGFFLLIWFKGSVYFWFLGFVILNLITITYWRHSNDIITMFFAENPVNYQLFGFMIDMTKWGILVLFGRVFIETKTYYPKLDKLLLISGTVFIAFSIFIISAGPSTDPSAQSVFLVIPFMLIIASILGTFFYFIFSKNALARFFSIGAVIPFLGILLIAAFRQNLWMRNFSEVLLSMGPMITLTLAIVFRFKQEAQGRIHAEQEKNILLENQTQTLEEEVRVRTAELHASLEDLKATQDQLIQQEKLASLGQLTAGIAHEIKNPLNFVNNFSGVSLELIEEAFDEIKHLEKNPHSDEVSALLADIKSNLTRIHEHGTRANSIVSSMLLHSRGGDGKKEPTQLNAVVKEYTNLAYHGMRAGKHPVDVEVDVNLDESVSEIPLVVEDFSRVILNLCNNGFDALRQTRKEKSENREEFEAKLSVRTKREGDKVTIEIEDNGPGIPEDIKDKILQPFFTTKKGTEGTGLGLSITNDIIKAHGGALDIESKPGQTIFRIQLTHP